jgi:CubicO group peptidase (beta-lactamase class C family)
VGTLTELVDGVAADTGFAGVVRVDREGDVMLRRGYGLADRRHGIPMTPDHRLAVASGTKLLTALVVLSLVEEGRLDLSTTARSVLGSDLPLIADDVTVEHLLEHRSGIGDYLDEEDDRFDVSDYVLPVPVHELTTIERFLPLLDGYPTKFRAGERFGYCNSGFVVLALIAERASGVGYHDLVHRRVCTPAGLTGTGFLRSDALPGDAAVGYVEVGGEWRTNVFHLPVVGTGDGGHYTTVDDVQRLWVALLAGRIVAPQTVTEMVRPRSDVPEEGLRHGLGVWLHPSGDAVITAGQDAGVSFYSLHDPVSGLTLTVIGTTAQAAWPVARALREQLGTD